MCLAVRWTSLSQTSFQHRRCFAFTVSLSAESLPSKTCRLVSRRVEIVRAKSSLPTDMAAQPLSPVNNARRSQFAPVLSSTPVHQTSPTMPIPVDLTSKNLSQTFVLKLHRCPNLVATPSIAPTYTMTSNDLPAVPPSAIVPQRAATRPPRLPRAESASRQQKKKKKDVSTVQEQPAEEELIIVTSKQRIETTEIQLLVIEQAEMVKTVQATPMRGRKKKTVAVDPPAEEPIPQLEPPPAVVVELPPKPSRAGRNKKKVPEPVDVPTRTRSSRTRKKQPEEVEEIVVVKEIPSETLPKKSTRSRKKTEETAVTAKTRSAPSRKKKKSTTPPPPVAEEVPEPIVPLSPKRTNTRSKKRKENDDRVEENPVSKRPVRGRRMKSAEPPKEEQIEIPVEKQDEIVLTKKARGGRTKKSDAPIPTSVSMDAIVSKPPRPPVARKKKSIAMPPISQMSPSTPPSAAQRIRSTSPIQEAPLLPLPVVGRRRAAARRAAPESPPTTSRNQKRSQSSAAATPKRARRENLVVTSVLGTPGKKRNKCTCEKRGHRVCDICAAAVDAWWKHTRVIRVWRFHCSFIRYWKHD